MLIEKISEEIRMHMAHAKLKMERGEVSNYHIYAAYVEDVSALLEELDRLNGRDEIEARADEIVEQENERIRNKTIGRFL